MMVTGSFQEYADLLRRFLTHRDAIAERIESFLNAQRKPVRYPSLLFHDFEACFLVRDAITAIPAGLRTALEEVHWSAGFRPRQVQHVYNDLIHPAEMTMRAVHCWQHTRWPGRGDRLHYAHTLFNLYVLRWLQFLSIRVFDGDAGARLREIQALLDRLWSTSPAGQPALVRDARWLIPLALSLITDELAPYFEVARQVTDALPDADALEVQKAQVRMLGGHLTSQIRHYSLRDTVSIDEQSLVSRTRSSNALDVALLIQGLVALLNAYERALQNNNPRTRLDLAAAICQGISPDPELFLNRVGLLRAYSMIEHVFIVTDTSGRATYSPAGQRHVRLLEEYASLIHRLASPLRDDFPQFKPVAGGYSPYGVMFGLPSNLIEHMALKALQRDAEARFSLEDVFDDDPNPAKLAWVNGWRDLPHVPREVQRSFDYPQQFAEEIYARIGRELHRSDHPATGRLHFTPAAGPGIPELPARHFASSGRQQLLASRQEGHFLVSYETPGGWIALKKDLLTEVLGVGTSARIPDVPPHAAEVLQLMCPDLAAPPIRQAS